MTYETLYRMSVVLLGETPDSTAVSDYSSRADYLLPGITAALAPVSALLGTATEELPTAPVSKTDEFPLAQLLANPAAYMLAAGLIRDKSPELAEKFDSLADKLLGTLFSPDIGSTKEVM